MDNNATCLSKFHNLTLEEVKKIVLDGDIVRKESWTNTMQVIWRTFGGIEIIRRPETNKAILTCIRNNAHRAKGEHKRGKIPDDTNSPHALAYAIKKLRYSVALDFSESTYTKKTFLEHYYNEELVKVIFDQLYPSGN